jgi:hypothetical protein
MIHGIFVKYSISRYPECIYIPTLMGVVDAPD